MSTKDPNSPIRFDEEMNEYHIAFKEPSEGHYIMRYCFSCGGKMPKSKRRTFFMDIDRAEVKKLRSIMRDVKNVESMILRLGPSDAVHEWTDEALDSAYEIEKWKAQYIYDNLWKTLSLCVTEKEDGTVNYVYYQKAKK
ncbi:hypothetical protein L0152_11725 [bacterium]|nr:hypothetical protein [bacterium]